nr:16S rRNA processing protein RimM [Phenylobacterium sp.]
MGKVKTIQDFGAGDLIEVQPPMGASWWLPFTREAVPEVRLAEGKLIAVRPAEIDGDAEEG